MSIKDIPPELMARFLAERNEAIDLSKVIVEGLSAFGAKDQVVSMALIYATATYTVAVLQPEAARKLAALAGPMLRSAVEDLLGQMASEPEDTAAQDI
jgi:hypothetical protein